ncbi:hypothetical protein LINGRAPRIM_LOCUS1349 [Linum grandiflorum]
MAHPVGLYATSRNNTVQPQHGGGGGGGSGSGGGNGGGGGGGGGSGGGNGGGSHYSPGGPSAVTWKGRCSNEHQMLPTSDSAAAQLLVMTAVGDVSAGNVGCHSQNVTLADGTVLPVYITFTCTLQASDKCSACFNNAADLVREWCPGRAGATFSSDDNCCLRYELYYFCGTAVNWQWRCSNEENMLPTTTDITAAQSQILQGVGGARFSSGNVVGCYTQEFVVNDGSALLAVYSSFTCGWQPSDDRCSACLNDAVKRMQDECPGRAGAAFSDNVNCCLRYELYNFCGTADECRV